MSQVFGYICSDDSLTAEVMKQAGEPLRAIAPEERIGLGVGYLQDGRSLLRKHPKRKAASVDVPSLLADIPSRSMVGHVRHKSRGRAGTKQLQPFRYRKWVYAQSGASQGLRDTYDALRQTVPDHVRRNIEGTTMAELIFHIFVTKVESDLSKTPQGERPKMYADKLAETMVQLQKLNTNNGDDGLGSLQVVAVTDRCIVGARIGGSLHYRLIEGIEQPEEEPLFAGHKPKTVMHDRFRALLVANGVDDDDWEEIPDQSVMWVDRSWEIHRVKIG